MWQLGSWGCRLGAINGGLVVEIVGWAIYLAAWWLRLSVGDIFGSLAVEIVGWVLYVVVFRSVLSVGWVYIWRLGG